MGEVGRLPDEEHEVWKVGQHEGGLVPPSAISSSSEGLQLGEQSDSGSDVGDDQMVMLGCQETAAGSDQKTVTMGDQQMSILGDPQKGTCSTNGDTQDGLRCRGIDRAEHLSGGYTCIYV